MTTRPLLLLATAGVAVVLVVGLLWLHAGQGDCPTATNGNRTIFWTSAGGAGQQAFHGVPGLPPSSVSSPSVPAVAGGRILVTLANNRATLTVPIGTMIDVELTSAAWTAPVSSDPNMRPRLSSSSSCDGVRASFRVQGNGRIEAVTHRGSTGGIPDIVFRVNVVASP
ncbi:MAG TPA: hypothetical protein VEQ12_07365 [Candidatus Limnocylindria bacterium]|nr:hypothetical protein [Candidatus Limnocylindria bacterium]